MSSPTVISVHGTLKAVKLCLSESFLSKVDTCHPHFLVNFNLSAGNNNPRVEREYYYDFKQDEYDGINNFFDNINWLNVLIVTFKLAF